MREAGSVQSIAFLALFPLTFGSSVFASANAMPGWLQSWVKINPVTHLTDAVRGLLTGGPVAHDVLLSLGHERPDPRGVRPPRRQVLPPQGLRSCGAQRLAWMLRRTALAAILVRYFVDGLLVISTVMTAPFL